MLHKKRTQSIEFLKNTHNFLPNDIGHKKGLLSQENYQIWYFDLEQ
jgi:hypothetical protein